MNVDNTTYFDSYGVKYTKREILRQQKITINIYRIQPNDSIMYGYSCIGFIDFMLFFQRIWKNDKITLKYF